MSDKTFHEEQIELYRTPEITSWRDLHDAAERRMNYLFAANRSPRFIEVHRSIYFGAKLALAENKKWRNAAHALETAQSEGTYLVALISFLKLVDINHAHASSQQSQTTTRPNNVSLKEAQRIVAPTIGETLMNEERRPSAEAVMHVLRENFPTDLEKHYPLVLTILGPPIPITFSRKPGHKGMQPGG